MRSVEKSARTVEEAVALALAELGADRDRAQVEVLDEGRSPLFGLIGGRNAVVRVTLRESRAERVERFLTEVSKAMGVDSTVRIIEERDVLRAELSGGDAGILIGRHGQTLEALQFLTNLVALRAGDGPRVIVDAEGYRRRREEAVRRMALRTAEQVRRSGRRMVLEPMAAHERRLVHMALAGNPHVITSSEGEEPYRRVVVMPRR